MDLVLERRTPPLPAPAPAVRSSVGGFGWTLTLVLILAAFLRLYGLDDRPLWIDEGMSLSFAQRGLFRTASLTDPVDISHPPAYYVMLSIWQLVSTGEWWLRFLSVVLGVITVAFTGFTARNIGGRSAGLGAALLIAVFPYHIQQSQTVRMYTLITATTAIMLWVVSWVATNEAQAANIETSRSMWTIYGVASTVLLYAHGTSIIVVAGVTLSFGMYWLNGARNPKILYYFIITQSAALLMWLPFTYGFIVQLGNIFGAEQDVVETMDKWSTLRNMWFPYAPAWRWASEAVLVVLYGYGLWSVRARPRWLAMIGAAPLSTLVFILVADRVVPLFTARAVIWTLIPIAIAVGIGIGRLPVAASILVLSAVGITAAYGSYTYYNAPESSNFEMVFDPWPEAANFVAERVNAGDVVLLSPGYIEPSFNYYYVGNKTQTQRIESLPAPPPDKDDKLIEDVDEIRAVVTSSEDVWLVRTADRSWDPNGLIEATIRETHEASETVRMLDLTLERFRRI